MTGRIRHYFLLGLLAISFNTSAATDDSGVKIQWSYKGNLGPARWGQLDPGFKLCAEGRDQSPINIKIKKNVKPSDSVLTVHYEKNGMDIIDNGSTSITLGNTQYIVNDGHSIQLNFSGNQNREWISYAGKQYKLIQFHFHSPSENQINSVSYPMEIHFVHQGMDGKAVAMGVFVKAGKENPELQKIIAHIPTEKGKEFIIKDTDIDPSSLLPEQKNYYSFRGSLTTPPCVEGVQWIVMANPVTASPAQILILRRAAGGENARPVQPLHHRPITYSVEKNI